MARLLGIDVGTSGCKVLLVDEHGTVLSRASASYSLSNPKPTWSEQNPGDWWTGVVECISWIGGVDQVDAIGVTGQMHGAVFLDGKGEVVRPAILWNDQRTAAECVEIDLTIGPARVRAITCNPPLTGFQLPKVLWLRKQEPANFARVRKVLLPKDYLRYRLTGELATEPSDASGTGIFDVPHRRWSEEMAEGLGISMNLLPSCVESTSLAGRTPSRVPVVGGGGDQAVAAVGTGAVSEGIVSISLGTSGVVFSSLESPKLDPTGALHTFCHANGKWHAMGVMLACGGALSWFRQTLMGGKSYDEIASQASCAKPGCRGLTFLPYLSGERSPHNDPDARAAWIGLTMAHGADEMSRAVFEGATFGLADSLDRIEALGVKCDEIRVTGGGARSGFWVQMLADVFGTPCSVMVCDEGPAFGAALLAGVGIGVWGGVEEACRDTVKVSKTYAPSGVDYREAIDRYRTLYPRVRGA